MIAVVTLEGVLAAGDNLKTAQPTKWAKPLYDALRSEFRVIGLTSADEDVARWWTKRESLYGWAGLMSQEAYLGYEEWRVEQIRTFLAEGWEVGVVLDPDPAVLKQINDLGVMTLTIGAPTMHLGFRQHEAAPRPWNEVSSTL